MDQLIRNRFIKKVNPLNPTALLRWLAVFLIFTLSSIQAKSAFQEALWGARPSGMVGAFTALADDANAPAYNPAGISHITQHELTIMYAQLYSGLDLHVNEDTSRLGLGYFSYVPNIKDKKYGSYAISWSNFVASNLLREDTFSLTYADAYQFEQMETSPVLSYGTNLKFLRRSFSTDSQTDIDPVFNGGRDASAFTADLGLMFHPYFSYLPGLKFGAAIQNITEPDIGFSATDKVPAKYTLGVAYQDRQIRWLNPALEFSRRKGRTLVTAAWESYLAKEVLAVRLGGNEDQLGGGLGYRFQFFRGMNFRLDYSLLWPLNVEGTNGSHRVSLTTSF